MKRVMCFAKSKRCRNEKERHGELPAVGFEQIYPERTEKMKRAAFLMSLMHNVLLDVRLDLGGTFIHNGPTFMRFLSVEYAYQRGHHVVD